MEKNEKKPRMKTDVSLPQNPIVQMPLFVESTSRVISSCL